MRPRGSGASRDVGGAQSPTPSPPQDRTEPWALGHGPFFRGVIILIAIALLGIATARADDATKAKDEAAAKQKLEAVRDAERALEAERSQSLGEQKELLTALRQAETAVGDVARRIDVIDRAIAERQAELAKLAEQRAEIEGRIAREREAVGALLRSVYLVGRDAPLKMMLAPDRIGDAARLLAYQRYLQDDRVARINKFRSDLDALARVVSRVEAAQHELAVERERLDAERLALDKARRDRAAAVADIDRKISDQNQRLALLAADERNVLDLLQRLTDAIADIPKVLAGAEPLASLKGRLPWPAAGALLRGFGTSGSDGRAASGLLIGARPGSAVKVIARGRVAYADWLKGYGLIAIVDHGDGYLSLYAHNESLLKDVGEWIEAGETIATVGNSGGYSEPALYFELRFKGAPQDPAGWLGKR